MPTDTVLVVGGAGYIGSHMVSFLEQANIPVIILDNLSTGHKKNISNKTFYQGNAGDENLLSNIFTQHKITCVMHFAAHIEVGESVKNPGKYYQNNVSETLALLNMMTKHQIKHFVFSSTAAVFGEPQYTPIDIYHPKEPVNPYGKSKLIVETLLKDFDAAHNIKSVCLRYFNAAGAHPDGILGEEHEPETHLIPLVLQTAAGKRKGIKIYGNDYNTFDGTCIRDYIHVWDLCDAHLRAMHYLKDGNPSAAFNLGCGKGYSVKEVIDTAWHITQVDFRVDVVERRPGDPSTLVADSSQAQEILGWKATYSLEDMISHAWQFLNRHGGKA